MPYDGSNGEPVQEIRSGMNEKIEMVLFSNYLMTASKHATSKQGKSISKATSQRII